MIGHWSLSQIAEFVGGQLLATDAADVQVSGVSTDTRTIKAGDLYVPLSGEHFNGHDFIADAAAKGAVATLVEQVAVEQAAFEQVVAGSPIPVIAVKECLLALGELAGVNRNSFTGPVVSVTGSAGKTSVKQLMASVLSQVYHTWMTQGNQNNHIGAPLTLLALNSDHQAAVIELGASGLGEIAYTAQWVRPQVGIITNAAEAHIEGFGSLQGVVQTKGELIDFIQPGGTAVLNADDAFYVNWARRAEGINQLSFGLSAGADVRAENIRSSLTGSDFDLCFNGEHFAVSLPLPGVHNVRNALAVAAAAFALQLPGEKIVAGLNAAQAVKGRLQRLDGSAGQQIINDAYNANPASVEAAIDVLKNAAQSWLVLGDMAELGPETAELHARCGRYAKAQGIKHLLAAGELSRNTVTAFGDGAEWFASKESLTEYLQQHTGKQDVILVKGSRSAGMETVVLGLQQVTEEN